MTTRPAAASAPAVAGPVEIQREILLVDGYSRDDYILPLIGREGNYHCLEISMYQEFLKKNIKLRAERFVSSNQKSSTTH